MAFRGAADPIVSDAEIRAWRAQTNGTFTAETLPGRHFFSADTSAQVRRRILQRLALPPDQADVPGLQLA